MSICDFCSRSVTSDDANVGLIKGAEALADFEQKINREHERPSSRQDPNDGEPVFFACPMCLLQYAGKCSKCGTATEDLAPAIIRGETSGNEVEALLCEKCLAALIMGGGTFGGFSR